MSQDPLNSSPSSQPPMDDSSVWDWGQLLDFTIDEEAPLILPWDEPSPPPLLQEPSIPESPIPESSSGRVRKRDPRLVCENYLAGRVPCACPEMDAMLLEMEAEEKLEEDGGRKRVKVVGGGDVRCQVPGCEADIKDLKGYHKRHRVCLRCANATAVLIDGEEKRYCQQCGKFHILPDFDEGKRSCRRKLERHNKRRRRRPTDFISVVEKEKGPERDLSGDGPCEEDPREENRFAPEPVETVETVVSNKVIEREILLEMEDGHCSPISSIPSLQNKPSNDIVSFAVSSETRMYEGKDNSKSSLSSSICDDRTAYSSVCPTGRISFKLYDWNPAEFPRRLRHQIFQWLANMPVELEGYIRPGCTILTIFIAMPQFMWEKLSQDAAFYIRDLVNAPESMFLGRGSIYIYLNNMIVQSLKDGASLDIKTEAKAPRIHYVHPTYFEAGKPMEFVACGSNIDQPKLRFLVSFAGKYLVYDSFCAVSHGNIKSCDGNEGDSSLDPDHEMFKIRISQTDLNISGPAFVEVDNESGISNFIPVLFGNKHICSELERMQGTVNGSLCANSLLSQIAVSGATSRLCEVLISKQTAMSELLVDIAWLLKEPCMDKSEASSSSINAQRLTWLLKFSIENAFVHVLEVILHYLDATIGRMGIQKPQKLISDAELELLLLYMNRAKEILNHRFAHVAHPELESGNSCQRVAMPQSYDFSAENQDAEARHRDGLCSTTSSSQGNEENLPLVSERMISRKHCYPHPCGNWCRESWANNFSLRVTRPGLFVFIMATVIMCCAACIVFLHPLKGGEFAVSIRRHMFDNPLP